MYAPVCVYNVFQMAWNPGLPYDASTGGISLVFVTKQKKRTGPGEMLPDNSPSLVKSLILESFPLLVFKHPFVTATDVNDIF